MNFHCADRQPLQQGSVTMHGCRCHAPCAINPKLNPKQINSTARDFWYEFIPGERIGVVGPNGAGKSTLLAAVAGRLELASGERDPGETTAVGMFTQEPIQIPEDMTMTAYLRCLLLSHPSSMRWQRTSMKHSSVGRCLFACMHAGTFMGACMQTATCAGACSCPHPPPSAGTTLP